MPAFWSFINECRGGDGSLSTLQVPTQSRFLVDRAVRHAMYLIKTDQILIISAAVDNPDLQSMTVTEAVRQSAVF